MTVGGDADAMRMLAARLDAAAAALTDTRTRLAAVAAALNADDARLERARSWAADTADVIRYRAAMLDEAGSVEPGREWWWAIQVGRALAPAEDADAARRDELDARIERDGYDPDPGFLGHARRVSRAAVAGLVDGVAGPARGLVALAGASARAQTAPLRAAGAALTGGWSGLGDEITGDAQDAVAVVAGAARGTVDGVRESMVLAPIAEVAVFAARARRDGVWRAAEDDAYDHGNGLPGVFLSVVPGGEASAGARELAVGQVRSPSTAASALAGLSGAGGGWNATANDRAVLELAVPVPGADELVAFDYHNGDFLVAQSDAHGGVSVERHRWSQLGDDRRQALRKHGLVDGHGRPLSPDGRPLSR